MKKLFSLVILSFLFFSFTSATTTSISKTENGHAYKVMKVSLDGKSKIVVSVVNNMMPAQSLKTLMTNVGGTHAINGSFFCPNEGAYSRCEGNTTDGLRVSNGVLYSKRGKDVGDYKSVFGFDNEGMPLPLAEKNPRYRANNTWQNDAVDTIFNGMMLPTLVKDGVNVAVLFNELNNDPKQGKAGNKTFICSTQDKSIVYMGYVDGVTFSSIADYIIETFGCYNAGLLDNGGTKAMINNGKYVAGPGRNMMDAFVVIEGNNVGAQIAPINMATETTTSVNSQELQTAVTWMYSKGLTSKSTVADYLPNNTMTREEASKFFSVFAKTIYNKSEGSATSCNFSDIKRADPTLRDSITSACRLGIFQGYKNTFTPLDKLTKAQAITVLMRVMVGKLAEPSKAYYTNYYLKAKEFKLTENVNVNTNITRGEAAILLYKANAYREKTNVPVEVALKTEDNVNTNIPVTCGSSQHNNGGGSCISNTKTCYASNGIGTQQWNTTSRGSCILNSCEYGYTLQNGNCIASARACNITNGVGQQTWNGSVWSSCALVSCNSGYINAGNYCLAAQSRACTITNGQGIQTGSYSSSYTWVWGTCRVTSCNVGYVQSGSTCIVNIPTCTTDQHLENNVCVSNIMSCSITNGIAQQTWSGGVWGSCILGSCNAGYIQSGSICIVNVPTCTADQHLESNVCISNTMSCTISNGVGQQTWTGGVWNLCVTTACNIGYIYTGGICDISTP